MTTGEWLPPRQGAQVMAGEEFSAVRPGPAYELRPLSLGEILDRTFADYRAHFWLFVGIATLSGAVQLLANAIQLLVYRGFLVHAPIHTQTFREGLLAGLRQSGGGTVTALLFFLAAAITQAATVWALSEVYLGRPASIERSIRAVIAKWYRYVGIALWQAWSAIWVPVALLVPATLLLLFAVRRNSFGVAGFAVAGFLIMLALTGGIVYGAIAFLRNSLGVQAAVVEGLRVRTSMRRSKTLTRGAKGRTFIVFLIAWCLLMVAGAVQMPLSLIVVHGALRGERHLLAEAGMLLIDFLGHVLVSPVVLIGLSLVYFDQRVRQEALDILLMLGGDASAADGENSAAGGGNSAADSGNSAAITAAMHPTNDFGPASDVSTP